MSARLDKAKLSFKLQLQLQLQEKTAQMYACLDNEDVAGYMNHFAEDATFESLYGAMPGRETIRAFMDKHIASGMGHGVRHFLSNFHCSVNGTSAQFRFYAAKMQVTTGPSLIGTGAVECLFDISEPSTPLTKITLYIDEAFRTAPECGKPKGSRPQ